MCRSTLLTRHAVLFSVHKLRCNVVYFFFRFSDENFARNCFISHISDQRGLLSDLLRYSSPRGFT